MRKLTKKWQMFLYAIGGMGVNMLNLMVGSYLCSAIIATGFDAKVIGNHTFLSRDLVIPAVWAIFGIAAKIIDGVIDVPMASFTDNLKTKFGRRRPALLIGLIPMVLNKSYCLHHYFSVQFSSVAQSCPTLCNPMNCSTPGLPVHPPSR